MRVVIAVAALLGLMLLSGCTQEYVQYQPSDGEQPSNGSQVADPCEGVTCTDYCQGATRYASGYCTDGQCAYTLEYNSPLCTQDSQPNGGQQPDGSDGQASIYTLDIGMRSCIYDADFDEYDIFFTIKNLGHEAPPQGGSIWVTGSEVTNKACHQIQKSYGYMQIFWGDLHWEGYPYQGQEWVLRNFPAQKDFEYRLIYCPDLGCLTTGVGDCTSANGEVWYSGSTSDCIYQS